MLKSLFVTACATALLLPASLLADDQATAPAVVAADPIVCHTAMHEGFPRTDCFHQSQWDAMRKKGQAYLRDTQLRAQQSRVHMGPVHGR